MGFFSRLGSRISGGLHSGARMGMKALGEVHRVGNSIAHNAEKVVDVVDRIPIVGQVLSPISGVVRSGIGLVKDVADGAKKGSELLSMGDKLLSQGETAVKSQLEKGSNVSNNAKKIIGDVSSTEMARDAIKQGIQRFKNA